MEAINEENRKKEFQTEEHLLQPYNKDEMSSTSLEDPIQVYIKNEPMDDPAEMQSDLFEVKEEIRVDVPKLTAPKEKPVCIASQEENFMAVVKSESADSSLEFLQEGNSLNITKKDDEAGDSTLEDPLFIPIKEEPNFGNMSDEDIKEEPFESQNSMEEWTMKGNNQRGNVCKELVKSCSSDYSPEAREVSTSTETLQVHSSNIQVHSQAGKQPLKCSEHQKSFTESSSLASQMHTHMKERPFKCTGCGKAFAFSSDLKAHMGHHTGEQPFKCNECSKVFTGRCQLIRHLRSHKVERRFKCTDCEKAFSRTGHLKIHMRTHTGELPFKCTECGKAFSCRSHLKTHTRTHTGEHPFVCSKCGKTFIVNSNLVIHMRSHTGVRPFKCTECGKAFIASSHLVVHMRTHTGERPFDCSDCSKTFKLKLHLIRHIRSHRRGTL